MPAMRGDNCPILDQRDPGTIAANTEIAEAGLMA